MSQDTLDEVEHVVEEEPQTEAPTTRGEDRAAEAFERLTHAADALRRRDLARALVAVSEAIDLDPESPEGYRLRSRVHRLQGDYVSAARDWAAFLARDPHAARGDEIRAAALRLREAIVSDRAVDESWDPSTVRSAELRQILEERAGRLNRRRAAFVRPACALPCPSQCCHFEREAFVYGVCVEPAQLEIVKAFLTQNQLDQAMYLGRTPASECTTLDAERLARFVVEEQGERHVYFPRKTARGLRGLTPRARPKSSDGRDLAWINPHSGACAFVSARGCLIHDLGDPPGLTVCRGFLCLTAFVYLVLDTLGLVPRAALEGAALEDLNDRAIAALLRLDACWLTDAEVLTLETGMRESLAAAIDIDARDEQPDLVRCLDRYRALAGKRAQLLASRREGVRALAAPKSVG